MTHYDAFDGHSAMTTEPIVRLWFGCSVCLFH
jgi:hypothetical protein